MRARASQSQSSASLFTPKPGKLRTVGKRSWSRRSKKSWKKLLRRTKNYSIQLIQAAYKDLAESIKVAAHHLPSLEDVRNEAYEALRPDRGQLMITKVNSEEDVMRLLDDQGQLRLRTPLNIFIGGQILDRGITVANLIGFFYGRRPNRFQQIPSYSIHGCLVFDPSKISL